MGRDRRLIDSDRNEAKVDATDEALQVKATFASTNDLDDIDTVLDNIQTLLEGTAKVKIWDGTDTLLIDASGQIAISNAFATEATLSTIDGVLDNIQTLLEGTQITKVWDGTNYLPSMDVAARAGFQKVTDGTDVLDVFARDTTYSAGDTGLLVLGYRVKNTEYWPIPVIFYTDAVAEKGDFTIPITPMTGGKEEGTFTRGLIPETSVVDRGESVNVPTATWTTITTYTVPVGNTLWVTDISIVDRTYGVAGIEFLGSLYDGSNNHWYERCPAGNSIHAHFHKPLDFAAETVVDLSAYQWSGGDKSFNAYIIGFLTVDGELD